MILIILGKKNKLCLQLMCIYNLIFMIKGILLGELIDMFTSAELNIVYLYVLWFLIKTARYVICRKMQIYSMSLYWLSYFSDEEVNQHEVDWGVLDFCTGCHHIFICHSKTRWRQKEPCPWTGNVTDLNIAPLLVS